MDDEPVNLLVSGDLVNVGTGTVSESFVAVDDGRIVVLEERPAAHELDAEYIAPGLIDTCMHVKSSMVTLPQYADTMMPRDVTSVVHDPHEIANVSGVTNVEAMVADATRAPLKVRFTVPSSAPATTLQDRGATLDTETVGALLGKDEVVALGGVMNVLGVVAGDDSVHEKVRATRDHGLTVDGRAPRVHGNDLQTVARYLDSNHKSIGLAEAREKVKAGLRIYLREDSVSKNLADVVGFVDEVGNRRLSLCTDGRDVVDPVERGGVDFTVRKTIRLGVDPVETVQMATVNTTEGYGLPFGRIRPGAPADLVLLSDLRTWEVDHIVINGAVDPTKSSSAPPASAIAIGAVRFEPISVADLVVRYVGDYPVRVKVVDMVGGLQTGQAEVDVPVAPVNEEWVLTANADNDILPLAVIERHRGAGGIGRGFVRGFGLERGAAGSTVAHDAHSCIVAGVNHDSMATMANHLRGVGGGVAAYDPEDDALSSLALPMGGLMSDESLGTVEETFGSVEATANDLGLDRDGGLMVPSFLTLEVIPTYQLTNNGPVGVESFEYVPAVID